MSGYDLIIVGAGPGGYEAAAHAGKHGLRVLLIEKELLGGTCLNCGCIPTKNLLVTAHFWHKLNHSSIFNISVENPKFDFSKIIEKKDRLLLRLRKGVENLLKQNKVEVVIGEAELLPGKIIKVNGKEYTANNIILATGSRPADIPGLTGRENVFNSTQILNIKELPKTMAIVGAGAIGLEFADIFSSFGSEVTVLEILPQVMPLEEREAVETLQKNMESNGIKFKCGVKIKDIQNGYAELETGERIAADLVLLAAGRKLNSGYIKDPGLKLGAKNEVMVNEFMETSVSGIYAIGDLNNRALYAHAATYQGLRVIDNIIDHKKQVIDLSLVPRVTFTSPQIAAVGKVDGVGQQIKKMPLMMLGRAQAENQTTGFIKIFTNSSSGLVEGVVIVADNAESLIASAIVLIHKKTTLAELADMIHPHPTFAELFSEAAKL